MLGSSSAVAMSPPSPTLRNDVFLSFRGEDTRDNFISHLYAELCRKKIETFIDNRLDRGEEISPALFKAIDESSIYVIVLSEHYASSTWCLDELTKILECQKRYGRDVIPVFYKVDPSNVRHQRESYAEAFVKHQQQDRFKDRVHIWKTALTQVAGLSGWDSQVTRPEHTLVEGIVKDIMIKLNRSFSSGYQGMIGIDKHIEQVQYLLNLDAADIRIIGIWGMGGIGKTTIASAIYHKLATQFSSSSIILNVQQEIERVGEHCIESKYLSELLREDNTSSWLLYDQRLERMKVFLVLDDASNSNQLIGLMRRCRSFGEGSRIIVTSRDMQVLKNVGADEIYEVREMDFQDSLRLFSLNAFKQNYPIETYADLSEKVLNYAKGIPLALKVLGLLLSGRTREAWESELQKLEKLPDLEVFKVLKLSFDGLDDEQKDIFLDIACFYRGHLENAVAQILDDCGFSAHIGMEVLKDRCLVSVSGGRIVMHDLVQEMGHEIVRKQCVSDPGKRSRLWKPEEIYHVLRKNKGTDAVQCIFLDICKVHSIRLHAETFKKLQNLRMIQFYKSSFWEDSNVILPSFLESLPDDLKFLRWDGFPQRSLPLDFCPDNLVKLDMPYSHLEQLWDGDQLLNIKTKIDAMPTLFTSINDLCWLDISDCTSLTSLPNEFFKLKFLRRLYVGGCSNLEELPEIEETVENLTVFILDKTAIKELPSSLHRLVGLEVLSLHECQRLELIPSSIGSLGKLSKLHLTCCESLKTFPSSIFKLKLTKLDLQGCSMLEIFPEILEPTKSFAHINLARTAVKELPSSFEYLVGIQTLRLNLCRDLVSLPNSIVNLSHMSELDCSGCHRLTEIPNNIGRLSSLRCLSLQKSSIVTLPDSITHLSSLKSLDLSDCKMLEYIPQLPPFLNQLLAFDCPSIRRVISNSRLKALPSDSKKGTFIFHFTNNQQLDASGHINIVAEAWLRITGDAYNSVFFCFPGSAVPHWFPYRCQGHSVTLKKDYLNWCNDNRLNGFALCFVLGHVGVVVTGVIIRYRLTFESDGHKHILPNNEELRNNFHWKGRQRFVAKDQTFLWKYNLDFASIHNRLSHAHNFTFEISIHSYDKSIVSLSVKECGICPLYTKGKDNDGGNSLRFLNNDIEGSSGSDAA